MNQTMKISFLTKSLQNMNNINIKTGSLIGIKFTIHHKINRNIGFQMETKKENIATNN